METIQSNGALNIASNAAIEVGKSIAQSISQLDRVKISTNERGETVTDVELRAEQQLIYLLSEAYPDFSVRSKLSGDQSKDSEYYWVIDALSGGQNFLHGHPHCAISIALKHQQELIVGVVYDPLRNELFAAHKGARAQLESRSMRVSQTSKLSDSLLSTGVAKPRQTANGQPTNKRWLKTFATLLPRTQGIHRSGSPALDLAYVAAGRYDGFWQFDLNEWEHAAGSLLVKEAGGLVSGAGSSKPGSIVAGNPRVQEKLAQLIAHSAS